jgi:hypothetical protein
MRLSLRLDEDGVAGEPLAELPNELLPIEPLPLTRCLFLRSGMAIAFEEVAWEDMMSCLKGGTDG